MLYKQLDQLKNRKFEDIVKANLITGVKTIEVYKGKYFITYRCLKYMH